MPLLLCFNSVNRPKVKISCSCQFNSASNDAATRSLLFFISYSFFLLCLPCPPHLQSHLTLPFISLFFVSRIELSCSSNRQRRESLVHLSSLTDGYFTPIIWVLCVCLRMCVDGKKGGGVPALPSSTHIHTFSATHPTIPAPHCAPAAIDGVSELRGDVLINLDTLGIDLTSCCNDLLVFVKDHCLSGLQLMPHRHGNYYHRWIGTGLAFRSLLFFLSFILSSHKETKCVFLPWILIWFKVAYVHLIEMFSAWRKKKSGVGCVCQKGDDVIGVNIFHVNVMEIITNWLDWLRRLNTFMADISFTCLSALLANTFLNIIAHWFSKWPIRTSKTDSQLEFEAEKRLYKFDPANFKHVLLPLAFLPFWTIFQNALLALLCFKFKHRPEYFSTLFMSINTFFPTFLHKRRQRS